MAGLDGSMEGQKIITVGIAGGSCGGKSLLSSSLATRFGSDTCIHLKLDSYYIDRSLIPEEERDRINFDHIEAFDWDLLYQQLKSLTEGRAVQCPQYDFVKHERMKETVLIEPKRIILLEGILALSQDSLRQMFDMKVFVDAGADTRLIRRIRRDVKERGRTMESVLRQYEETVAPMHELFVEPTKKWADIVVPGGGKNKVAIDVLTDSLRALLEKTGS